MTTLKGAGRDRWNHNVAGGCVDTPGAWDWLYIIEQCKWFSLDMVIVRTLMSFPV